MTNEFITQFASNGGVLTKDEQSIIAHQKAIIVGVGGLGGNIANNLVRLGIGELLLIDFDLFDISNLNRQLFSNHANVGLFKVNVVKKELLKINPKCKIEVLIDKVEDVKIQQMNTYDCIIDAVDSPQSKVYISNLAFRLNIPLLHGSCAGWYGQVGWILPGSKLINETYESHEYGLEKELLNPSFTPSVVAGVMCAEYAKYIKKDKHTVINEFLLIDILTNSFLLTGKTDG